MKGTLPAPKWIHHFWRGQVWYYCEDDVVFNSHKGEPITIPAYYLHNGGSIPWVFTAGLKPNGLMLSAYALHDYLFTKDCPYKVTRKHANKLLYQYGRLYGYSWIKCQAVYSGVMFGSWACWRKHDAFYIVPKSHIL